MNVQPVSKTSKTLARYERVPFNSGRTHRALAHPGRGGGHRRQNLLFCARSRLLAQAGAGGRHRRQNLIFCARSRKRGLGGATAAFFALALSPPANLFRARFVSPPSNIHSQVLGRVPRQELRWRPELAAQRSVRGQLELGREPQRRLGRRGGGGRAGEPERARPSCWLDVSLTLPFALASLARADHPVVPERAPAAAQDG